MLYNRCTGIYKFENNTYPRHIRRRSNLGHIFWEKNVSYGLRNMVYVSQVTCGWCGCVLGVSVHVATRERCVRKWNSVSCRTAHRAAPART